MASSSSSKPNMTVDEVKKVGKEISAAEAEGKLESLLSMLTSLSSSLQPTESLIRNSKIGQTVGKLRTHSDKRVSDKAKAIVKGWKAEMAKNDNASSNSSDKKKDVKAGNAKKEGKSSNGSTEENGKSDKASPAAESASSKSSPKTTKSASVSTSNPQNSRPLKPEEFQLGDKIRDACLKLIYDSLKFIHPTTATSPSTSSTPNNHYSDSHILTTAKKIELSTFLNISNSTTDQAYKAKIRSLSLNLKDKANPALKESVLNGDIESDRLVEMLPEEMASEERRKEREELILKNLFKAKAAEAQEAETDSFQCGRCKQRKCRYYQKQTRSADEPMTTFVTCTNCNHKWKFC